MGELLSSEELLADLEEIGKPKPKPLLRGARPTKRGYNSILTFGISRFLSIYYNSHRVLMIKPPAIQLE
jgi:hypothetical protein